MKMSIAAFVVAAVIAGPALAEPLAKGASAPDFTLTTTTGGKHAKFHLKDELKKGPVVLYFFPKANTPGCDAEAGLFSKATPDFHKAGAAIIGVSTDKIETLDEFSVKKCESAFPLGADPSASLAEQYGVKTNFAGMTIASRTSYVIGQDGKIAFVHSDRNFAEHASLTLAEARKLGGK